MWSSNLPFSEAFLFSLLSSNTCLLIGRICAISLSPDWSKPLLVVMWNLNSLSLGTYKKLCLWRKIMLHFSNHFSLLWWDLLVVVCPTTWATLHMQQSLRRSPSNGASHRARSVTGWLLDLISRFSGLLFNYFSLKEAESSSQYQFFVKTKKLALKVVAFK